VGNTSPYSAKVGRTIPIKFQVQDMAGNAVVDKRFNYSWWMPPGIWSLGPLPVLAILIKG